MRAPVRDLAEIVVEFIDSIPATIKPDVLVFVAAYSKAPKLSLNSMVFIEAVRTELREHDGFERMGATLRVVAALDYVLERSAVKIHNAERAMTSPLAQRMLDDAVLARFLAGHPLRERHYDQALCAWKILRETSLSQNSLMDYEDSLTIPQSPI